ncbi:MAG: TraR/DksA family transcriptional regulator, partial [Planctomycetota bacterium]
DLSSMPIHMADIGSDNWEQEFTLGLIDNERLLLREIDEALQRINANTYGICLATRKPISAARLRAKPWAKYCIEYARLREQGRVP